MTRALFIISLVFCFSCSPSSKINRIKAQNDIREAIFRYQFAQFQHSSARVYFLTIEGQDPSEDFMQKFAESKSFVKKGSEARQAPHAVVSATGERGVVCDVGPVKWLDEKSVEVIASYQVGNQSAAHFTLTVKSEQGKWKITGKKFSGASAN